MIEIKNLKFKYSAAPTFALDGINITIPDKKYIAVLGHNGSGKSTLSKILVGLYRPTEGTVAMDGIVISKKTLPQIRKKIGIVFQNPESQFIGASVEDDIAFGLENKQMSREEMKKYVLQYSKMVGMSKFLEAEPGSLSGGQKQRVAIASTLALDPSIIIFDEVTSMLDPKGKTEVLDLIKKIQQKKEKTLISITHNMDEAIMADEVIVLAGGKVIAQGRPQDILKNKKIVAKAKIDAPFVYKVSEKIMKNPTYDYDKLVGEICK